MLKSAGLEKANVRPYSSLPLCSFKRESDLGMVANLLPNMVQNRLNLKNYNFECKFIKYLDDLLICHQNMSSISRVVIFKHHRMKIVIQVDNLVLTDVNNPVPHLYMPRSGGEIFVSYFSFGAWIQRSDIHLFQKKSEHFRLMSDCKESCCFDETKQEQKSMRDKLVFFFNSLETKGKTAKLMQYLFAILMHFSPYFYMPI